MRVIEDRHVTGLFPQATWELLMAKAGFRFEKALYPVHNGGQEAHMIIGTVPKP